MSQLFSGVSEIWGDWMLSSGLQVAVVALIAVAILKIGNRKISSQFKYVLLVIVLVKFATPPSFHLPTGFFSQPAVSHVSNVELDMQQMVFPVGRSFESSQRHSDLADMDAKPVHRSGEFELGNSVDVSASPIGPKSNVGSANSETSVPFPLLLGLFYVYCLGVLVFLFRLGLGLRRLRKIVSESEIQTSGVLFSELSNVSKAIGLKTTPELRLSDDVEAPFATGALTPIVLLPRELTNRLSSDKRRIVISHELVHIRRWDLIVGWAEVLLGVIWWFHPAMWWLKRSLRQTREDCCDDFLIASQMVQAGNYCQTLIDAAHCTNAELEKRLIEPLALGFSGNEHPAGRRIRRLMDDSIFRTDRMRISAVCVAVLVALISLPGMRSDNETFATEPVVKDLQDQDIETATPMKITGKVIDSDGTPIEGASVRARVHTVMKRWEDSKYLVEQTLKTDAEGVFEIELVNTAAPGRKIHLNAEVSSKNCYAKHFHKHNLQKAGELIELEPYQLDRGIRIKGRLVAPDSRGQAPADAIVSIEGTYKTADRKKERLYQKLKCDKKGFFTGVVPSNCKLKLVLMARNYATNIVEHELTGTALLDQDAIEERDFGEMKLKQGTSVFGVAKYRDGRPASGVVLGLIEGEIEGGIWEDVSAAKTDEHGRFKFAPHTGKCMIFSLKDCFDRRLENRLRSSKQFDGEFPLIDSGVLDLSGKGAEFEIELTEAETVTISGVIRDERGRPVEDVTIQRGWYTDQGLMEVEYLYSDERGRYSIRVPKGNVPSLIIRKRFVDQTMYEPFLPKSAPASHKEFFTNPNPSSVDNYKLKFKPIERDIENLDWVMKNLETQRSVERVANRALGIVEWWFLGE